MRKTLILGLLTSPYGPPLEPCPLPTPPAPLSSPLYKNSSG